MSDQPRWFLRTERISREELERRYPCDLGPLKEPALKACGEQLARQIEDDLMRAVVATASSQQP